jgi:hypothetical protein
MTSKEKDSTSGRPLMIESFYATMAQSAWVNRWFRPLNCWPNNRLLKNNLINIKGEKRWPE